MTSPDHRPDRVDYLLALSTLLADEAEKMTPDGGTREAWNARLDLDHAARYVRSAAGWHARDRAAADRAA